MSELASKNYTSYIIATLVVLIIVAFIYIIKRQSTLNVSKSLPTSPATPLPTILSTPMPTPTSQNLLKNNNLYYPNLNEHIIYENLITALKDGIISKSGNPVGWDQTTYSTEKWNGFNILRIGGEPTSFPNGLRVTVPSGMSVIWVRCLNDRWISLQVDKLISSNQTKDLGNFCSGFRSLHKYSPDGAASSILWNVHTWFPIPVPGPGDYILRAGNKKNKDGTDLWISGLAFSSNPWNHAFNSAVAYHWNVNEGDGVVWNSANWNNDILAQINSNTIGNLYVPVVPNGKDKLLYIIEHNNNWDGAMHNKILVENEVVPRLRSTWNHPLARSVNSKMYNRFLATLVPKELIGDKTFIKTTIDLTNSNHNLYFREVGTIDLE